MSGSGGSYNPSTSKSGRSSDRVFQKAEDKAQKKITDYQRNVFVSYDMDNDKGMVSFLTNQAKDDRFPFVFRDYSVKEAYEEKWKSRVRTKISQTSAVIVAIGEKTHESKAIAWEIQEAHRQGKKVIGVRLRGSKNHKIPSELKEHGDRVIKWKAKDIAKELDRE